MSADELSLKVLTSFPNEMEAMPLVDVLAGRGIRAKAVGGYTAAFSVEIPGCVDVLVSQADLPLAQEILNEYQGHLSRSVSLPFDAGDGSEPPEDDRPLEGATDSEDKPDGDAAAGLRRPFQFSIASLLVLQTCVAVVCGMWKGISAAFLAIVGVGLLLAPVVVFTVWVSSDLGRAREVWREVGRILTVGMAVWLGYAVLRILAELVGAVLS